VRRPRVWFATRHSGRIGAPPRGHYGPPSGADWRLGLALAGLRRARQDQSKAGPGAGQDAAVGAPEGARRVQRWTRTPYWTAPFGAPSPHDL